MYSPAFKSVMLHICIHTHTHTQTKRERGTKHVPDVCVCVFIYSSNKSMCAYKGHCVCVCGPLNAPSSLCRVLITKNHYISAWGDILRFAPLLKREKFNTKMLQHCVCWNTHVKQHIDTYSTQNKMDSHVHTYIRRETNTNSVAWAITRLASTWTRGRVHWPQIPIWACSR